MPPALVIRLEFEGGPVVYMDSLNEGDEQRLGVWLTEIHPEYGEIAALAAELAQPARRAA